MTTTAEILQKARDEHTPGPWCRDGFHMSRVLHCTAARGTPEAKHLCGDYETIADCAGDNWEANARLVAAAPDLLAALKPFVQLAAVILAEAPAEADNISVFEDCEGVHHRIDLDQLRAARAAIAKAEGV
jgi:hypothetical protein